MITVETVLVLGAGASKDFGFPTGQELVRQICDMLTNSENWQFKLFNEAAGQKLAEEADKFPSYLMKADPLSIDAWLEHNPKFIEVGKIAIAIALLHYERKSDLRPEKNWYQLLFSRLNSPFEEFQNNKISIITFNYDRSLEQYLFETFRYTHTEKSKIECIEKINHLRIHHCYGSLGRLDWQINDTENTLSQVCYGAKPDINTIISAAESIKIIPEKRQEIQKFNVVQKSIPDEFNKVQKLIGSAQALYFLGFGYNDTNMQRLGIDTLRRPSKVMGTAYGLDYQRVRELEQLSIRDLHRNHGIINKSVYDFLYYYINFNELGLPKVLNY